MTKRLVNKTTTVPAALVAAAMLATACSSDGSEPSSSAAPSTAPTTGAASTLLSEKPVTFTWMVSDRKEAPVRNDWPVFEEIRQKTNVKIQFEPVPGDGWNEKAQISIATNSVSDFMPVNHVDVRTGGPDGIFLDLNKYLNIAPNLKKYYETYPEAKALVTGDDGGVYSVPVIEGVGFNYSWIVRQDLLEKYGLKNPTNMEEFYQMLKTLKEKHPDIYPLVPENASHNGRDKLFTAILQSFSGLSGFIMPDPNTNKYVYAGEHPGFKQTLEFMNKLYNEKLLDPEFAIIKSAQWEERILSGKGLVTWFWKTRVQLFNDNAAKAGKIDGYKVNAMPQFAEPGIKTYQYTRDFIAGNGIAISGKVKDKETAVKFLDYLVSPEGADYLAYGLEGKTYERVNGTPKFLKSLGLGPYNVLRGEYGIWYPNINLNNGMSRDAEILSDAAQAIEDMYKPILQPAPKPLVLNDKENELKKAKETNLIQYMDQKISEFIAGRTPINDDTLKAFNEQAIKLGAYELRDMYNSVQIRLYSGK